jgi:hypothetical protein
MKKQESIQEKVQREIKNNSQKKRKDMASQERVRLLQLKLYLKAKQEKARESLACMVNKPLSFWLKTMG